MIALPSTWPASRNVSVTPSRDALLPVVRHGDHLAEHALDVVLVEERLIGSASTCSRSILRLRYRASAAWIIAASSSITAHRSRVAGVANIGPV